MAFTKTRPGMVILREGAAAPGAAPAADHSPACLVALRTGKVHHSGTVQGTCVSSGETKMSGKHKMCPAEETVVRMGELKHPTSLNSPCDVPSPDCVCKDVKVTLDNNSMWNEFFKCRTEMILTKQGSRMFPYCRFRISGLQSSLKYSLVMDIEPLDNSQYKWTGESWHTCRKAERHVKSKPFVHPDSPATGQHWMQNPVSFYRLKLTDDISDQEGNIILHPMHRYLPQLYLVQADTAVEDFRLNGPNVLTFTFPQTEFITVTSYQNPQFTQLKVNYNPFAKKLKEDRVISCGLKLKGNSGKELTSYEAKTNTEEHPVRKSLKFLLANHKPRHSKASDFKLPAPKEPQEKSTMSNTQSAAHVPGESPSNSSRPAPKLISELICEAHVSLQRCNIEQRGSNQSNSIGAAQNNTTSTSWTDKNKQSFVHKNNGTITTSTRKSPTVDTTRNIKDKEHLSDVTADVRTECAAAAAATGGQVSSNKPDQQSMADTPSDGGKQQKRPVRLPLPALALFLKQHSTNSKKAKNKPDLPPQESLPTSCGSQSSASEPQQETSVEPIMEVKPIMEDSRKDVLPDEKALNGTKPAAETALQPCSPSSPDPLSATGSEEPGKTEKPFISSGESLGSGPTVSHQKASICENTFDSLEMSPLTLTCSTSASPDLSLHLSPALALPDPPKAAAESSTLPPGSRSMKIDSMLPDPQCSSFDFDLLSPASSPEPLPPLPASLALELDSATSAEGGSAGSFEDPEQDRNSSVFKWHTVLPVSGTYADSFTTLQPQQQSAPLISVAPSLLSCLPEPQSIDTSTPSPPKDPVPSFQESEQSLPFPAELSPLALQLPLSPTFSSLDEDGLSPTTSLSELVSFFSANDDIGVEFSNTDTAAVPTQPLPVSEPPQPSEPVLPVSASKPCKRKKSSRPTTLARLDVDHGDYRSKQPKVEEVEEQLFISFTSKEALKQHTAESSEEPLPDPQLTADTRPAQEPESSSTAENLEETIVVNEESLLRDLKLMKHRQVIHPVLQEVGLKMTLLDPALSIDLQYLGVCLPIPPPGDVMEPPTQTVPTSQGVLASFQSRTGKATDVTQIKGWKEKFTPLEAEPAAAPKPEASAGPSSDLPKKNLSAFCSDMLDEYLESEAKLIDERASSFSQPPAEAPAYQLPLSSTSYVRTLDHVLKKPTTGSPTSDIISRFIPPSKRSRFKATTCRKVERKQRGPKQNKIKAASAAPQLTAVAQMQTPGGLPQTTEPQNQPTFKKRRRLKPQTSSHTLGASMPPLNEDMAPLESDSELKADLVVNQPSDQTVNTLKKESKVSVTRSFARLKELQDRVVWEGCLQTRITEERATVALMSLFTQTGFVRENPTAPIRLKQREALRCLNDFCRLGCICSSLSHCSRISHCGRPSCMFGCSCLKQKVVILKNLGSSDSSPASPHGKVKKKRRRRMMMKMAYVLKEADTVTQPAERIRTLWRKDAENCDTEPVHAPEAAPVLHRAVRRKYNSSCARVRGFVAKMQKQKENSRELVSGRHKAATLNPVQDGEQTAKTVKTPRPPDAGQTPNSKPPSELPHPQPSKRLSILADCTWESDSQRSSVLKKLCEAMALDQLDRPFWIKHFLITPTEETVEESTPNKCIHYRVQISTPFLGKEKTVSYEGRPGIKQASQHRQDHYSGLSPKNDKPPKDSKKATESSTDCMNSMEDRQKEVEPMEDWQKEVEPMEDWQKEVEPMEDWQKAVEPMEDWQKAVEPMEDWQKEAGPMEDWQKEAGPMEDWQKEAGPMEDWQKEAGPMEDWQKEAGPMEDCQKEVGPVEECQKEAEAMEDFLKDAKDVDVQVNGKQYPFAKVQLGRMGALHPANRLAAYLTGRVGSQRLQQASSALEESCKGQSSPRIRAPTLWIPSASAVMLQTEPAVTQPAVTILPAVSEPKNVVAASSNPSLTLMPKDPEPLLIRVPSPQKVLHVVPPRILNTQGQMMDLKPVRSSSGHQYYQKPDGSLIQLIPFNQLRPVNPSATVQGAAEPSTSLSPNYVTATKSSTDSKFNARPQFNPRRGHTDDFRHKISEPKNVVAASSNPSLTLMPKDPEPLLIQVPSPQKVVHVVPPRILNTQGQRMVLKPIRSSSGHQYYQKPDGSLIQLIPFNQLRPVNPSTTVQGACPVKDPVFVNVPYLTPTQIVCSEDNLTPIQGSTHPVVPNLKKNTPLKPPVGQKTDLKVQSVPSATVAEGTAVEHQNASPQTQPTIQPPTEADVPRVSPSLAESSSRKLSPERDLAYDPADLDVVCVEATEVVDLVSSSETEDSVSSSGTEDSVSSCETEDSSDFTQSDGEEQKQLTAHKHGAAAAGESTGDGQQEEEKEDKAWHSMLEKLEESSGCGAAQQKMEMTSSSDVDSEEEAFGPAMNSARKGSLKQRLMHNMEARMYRAQLQQLFHELKKEVVPTYDTMPKISILKKAVKLIQELRGSEEDLKRKKKSLVKSRDKYLSILAPSAAHRAHAARQEVKDPSYVSYEEDRLNRMTVANGAAAAGESTGDGQQEEEKEDKAWHSMLEKLEESSGCGAAQQKMEMTSSSDVDSEEEALGPAMNSARKGSLKQAPREVQKLLPETERRLSIQSVEKEDDPDPDMKEAYGPSGLAVTGMEPLHHPLTNQTYQNQAGMVEKQQEARKMPVQGAYSVTPWTGHAEPLQTPQAAPCGGVGLPTAIQLQPLFQPVLHVSDCAPSLPPAFSDPSGANKQRKTVPNILSRGRNRALPLTSSAVEAPNLDQVLFAVQPGRVPHQAQELQPPLASVPSPFLLLSADCNQVSVHHRGPTELLSPAASRSSAPTADPPPDAQRCEPGGQEGRQDLDNESLSLLLNEIVFLNQQTVATATTAGVPSAAKDRLQDSLVSGGSEEQRQASDRPGLTSGNTVEGVLTPPPLLHMKVGGAKVAGLGTSDGGAVGGGGSEGVAWRPMPRLVPLGLRGNSPS
ncbi:MAX dimerization protein MGA a isoform X2 [Fundulus heteroclitus]|uniref:MAX dimerization protein MGA a isoform X2 n=1 Tax=Fundulus heteroclitus TaxID=8078 RepID=UPI00165C9936|nr:MAX dimerization protein MGA a isoform X2 [Fundulus heteroclitus]